MLNTTGGLYLRQQTPHLSFILISTALKQAATSHQNIICVSLQIDPGKTQESFLSSLLKKFALIILSTAEKKGTSAKSSLMLMALSALKGR